MFALMPLSVPDLPRRHAGLDAALDYPERLCLRSLAIFTGLGRRWRQSLADMGGFNTRFATALDACLYP